MSVRPTGAELSAALPGDDIVADANVVMDRAFTVLAPPDRVWPWFVQLGKERAGWYLPHRLERSIPRARRALRHIDHALQTLTVGDVIPDWGGADATFTVAVLDPPRALVHASRRGRVAVSWAITLTAGAGGSTRVHLRLRLGGVNHRRLAAFGGGAFDWLTIAGLAAGLRERLRDQR